VICLAKSPPSSKNGVWYTKWNFKTIGNVPGEWGRWIVFKEQTVIN